MAQSCRRCWESQNNLLGAPQGSQREGDALASIRGLGECSNQSWLSPELGPPGLHGAWSGLHGLSLEGCALLVQGRQASWWLA